MAAFLDMGGFAGFVWPCYALSVGAMIWLGVISWHRARTAAKQLAAMREQDAGGTGNRSS